MRKLASVQLIEALFPIEGADRIETAQVQGWYCVVKKGEFNVGDKCVYFEIDSILPETEWSEFMRPRKFRVKTAKFKKQIAQGLALPGETIGIQINHLPPGYDVTEALSVRKHDPEGDREARIAATQTPKKYPWYTKLSWGMKLYRWLHPKRGGWPDWLRKTDETRIQNIANLSKFIEGRSLYATEKLDGQSITVYFNLKEKSSPFSPPGVGGVCSRNIHYHKPVANAWWNIVSNHGILEALENCCRSEGRSLAIQGELCGPGIRDNKYKFKEARVYWFNVWDIDKQQYLSLFDKLKVLDQCGLLHVPFVCNQSEDWPTDREGFLEWANGQTMIEMNPCIREGIVIRDLRDDGFSFKAISNDWLLKYES